MTIIEVRCEVPIGNVCGEAATWSADEGRLYWSDVNGFVLHWLDTVTGAVYLHKFDQPVVAISLTTAPGRLLVSLGSKLIYFDVATGERTDVGIDLPEVLHARFNDGRADPHGVLWIGSMGNNVGPEGENQDFDLTAGKLYRYRAGGVLEEIEAAIGISNTVCWAPDGRTFYFGDTLANEIRAYPYDMATGDIGVGKTYFAGFDRGMPDGSCIDSEGCLWNARYGGDCVVRITPDGSIDRVLEMPCRNITTCCFGGPDLATLYITTAQGRDTDSYRWAGGVFACEPGVHGIPENRFSL